MIYYILLSVCVISSLFVIIIGAFAGNMQAVTLFLGRKLAPIGTEAISSRGIQDALTPRIQDRFNTYLPIAYLSILITGSLYKWFLGILCLVLSFIIMIFIKKIFPQDLLFYTKIIFWDLTNREADYQKNGDIIRAEAAHSFSQSIASYMELLLIQNRPIPDFNEAKTTSFGI